MIENIKAFKKQIKEDVLKEITKNIPQILSIEGLDPNKVYNIKVKFKDDLDIGAVSEQLSNIHRVCDNLGLKCILIPLDLKENSIQDGTVEGTIND